MKTTSIALFVVSLCFIVVASCRAPIRSEPEPFTSDPILAVGHGAFIGSDGKKLIPSAEFIERAQKYYIATLLKNLEARREKNNVAVDRIQETQKLIYRLVEDEILANALFIDWLLEKVQPDKIGHLTTYNNTLRWYYVLNIQSEPILPTKEYKWTKGIRPEIAEKLERGGITVIVFLKTNAGGAQYIQECGHAGVPIPPPMFSSTWNFEGTVEEEFLSEEGQTDLWRYASESPPGVCLSLPRYFAGSGFDEADLFGLICLGTESNKACFWDNPRGTSFPRDVEVDISEFVGGVDLVPNGQGVCTDCHAGENPYVVHPEKPPFSGLTPSLLPLGWHDPLVDTSWPQNPGPTNLLDAVASTGRCDSCHRVGSAGRFPEVSEQLPGYCNLVLRTAVGLPPTPKSTMPPFGADKSQFTNHIDALFAACDAPPSGGGVVVEVDFPDDEGFISPPIVIDPLYKCAERVAVRGAILDAKVDLFINGTVTGTVVPARNPSLIEFNVPSLMAGDVVTARQESNGVPSGPSAPVTVRDHTVDFPGGLPAPDIDPTLIHVCGDIIAVRHVPGAKITVLTNGGNPSSRSTSTGWSAIKPGKRPFDLNDSFTATAALCEDESSPSAPVSAVAAPATIPAPTFNPATLYAGQELVTVENIVYGSRVSIAEASFGPVGDFTWPVSWFPDFDVASRIGSPLSAGDQLVASQQLCIKGPETETPPAEECDALPAPRIRHPLVGDNFVVVTESVPGARIRVYDDSGDELGDGSGTVIMLKRAITGADTITVVQQVGKCTSSTGYRVSARNPSSSADK